MVLREDEPKYSERNLPRCRFFIANFAWTDMRWNANLAMRGQRLTARTKTKINLYIYTRYTQKNDAVSKVNKKFIYRLTRSQRTPLAAATVQVSHALPAVRFSCLLWGRGAGFQDGVAAGKGFLCAPF